jgi:hypothetical protein
MKFFSQVLNNILVSSDMGVFSKTKNILIQIVSLPQGFINWSIDVRDCMNPNTTVRSRTRAAIQNFHHCTGFLSSRHHFRGPSGSWSSNACFNFLSRTPQYTKWSILRFSGFRYSSERALGSIMYKFWRCVYHLRTRRAVLGIKRANVSKVSEINSGDMMDLGLLSAYRHC